MMVSHARGSRAPQRSPPWLGSRSQSGNNRRYQKNAHTVRPARACFCHCVLCAFLIRGVSTPGPPPRAE